MTLHHYSPTPWTLDRERTYEQPELHFKPNGLWLSVDDDWQRWCEGEDFNRDGLMHHTEIVISSSANILTISDVRALDAFTAKYRLGGTRVLDALRAIDWPRIVAEYDGILIAPYLWERRLTGHTFWYYC